MGQSRSWPDLDFVTLGNFHPDTGSNQLTLHRLQNNALDRANVHSCAATCLIFGKNGSRFQGDSNLDCHEKGCYRRILLAMRVHRISETFTLLTEVEGNPWRIAEAINVRFRQEGVHEAVASYNSIGIYAEPDVFVDCGAMIVGAESIGKEPQIHRIPICYEMGPDFEEACKICNLTQSAFISLHLGEPYRCFAVGFQPGFPYLGYLRQDISILDRLDRPRDRVPAGAVGIATNQCGIYPDEMPGGWRLIGLTPVKIVDVPAKWFPIVAGDTVIFERISELSYRERLGERLGQT